jgi:regulator of replication initiation timing
VFVDLRCLLETRLLVQANSGGGKSYFLRLLLEQAGVVQQIVFDLEGEFSTLREKFDFILVGKEGDIPIDVRYAEQLARKVLELNASVILDLYELKQHERLLFIRRFLDAMINAPKSLWHPCLVLVDEAHVSCPESDKAESGSAVKDLMTRGRKRGFGGVLATQRLSKLSKDAAAEACNNIIGRTTLDVDVRRAADVLGMPVSKAYELLRNLNPGEFYAYGPAISPSIIKFKASKVVTTHPTAGNRQLISPPPATAAVKRILSSLGDLPHQAEEELRTVEDYRRQIASLKAELRQKAVVLSSEEKVRLELEISRLREELRRSQCELRSKTKSLEALVTRVRGVGGRVREALMPFEEASPLRTKPLASFVREEPPKVVSSHVEPLLVGEIGDEVSLRPSYTRLLKAIAMFYPEKISRSKASLLADIPQAYSTFKDGLSKLKTSGFIGVMGNDLVCTELGRSAAGEVEILPTDSESLIKVWMGHLRPAYQKIFQAALDAYPSSISRQELSIKSGVAMEKSTFKDGLGKLKTLGLISVSGDSVVASKELFEGGV